MTRLYTRAVASELAASMPDYEPTIEDYGIGMTVIKAVDHKSKRCRLIGIEDLELGCPTKVLNTLEQTEAALEGAKLVEQMKLPGYKIRPVAIYCCYGIIGEDGGRANLDYAMSRRNGDIIVLAGDGMWQISHRGHDEPIWNEIHRFEMPVAYSGLLPESEKRKINREVRALQAQFA